MKSSFSARSIQYPVRMLAQSTEADQGFTLIELLVAVIIIGVLAAITLPNLLAQIGKGRETELRSTIGTINRAQQAFHFEHRYFGPDLSTLGVTITQQYQAQPTIAADPSGAFATTQTQAPSYLSNGTKAFSGRIEYSTVTTDYSVILCSSNAPSQNLAVPSTSSTCPVGSTPLR